jgi:tRNA pseudouridine32 synthase/23S rRNA pseudouridine746 synthase
MSRSSLGGRDGYFDRAGWQRQETRAPFATIGPMEIGLEPLLVHHDDTLIVVDKPAGLLTVPGRGADKQDCVLTRVQQRFGDARVVHRLDMATSGLLLLARGIGAQRTLGNAFACREVIKHYTAVVSGLVSADSGEIGLPLAPDWPNRPRQQVDRQCGKPSLTHYRTLGRDPLLARSRLELIPQTGRTHQLRVHLMAIGHPIVGDALYAGADAAAEAPRLMLHACRLEFDHPGTGQRVNFERPAPF